MALFETQPGDDHPRGKGQDTKGSKLTDDKMTSVCTRREQTQSERLDPERKSNLCISFTYMCGFASLDDIVSRS